MGDKIVKWRYYFKMGIVKEIIVIFEEFFKRMTLSINKFF